MTRHNLKYKRTIHKCLPAEEKKKINQKNSRTDMRKTTKGELRCREQGKAKGGCSTCQRQSPNDETKWEITTSFPTAASQSVCQSLNQPQNQNSPNNKQLRGQKKKKSTKPQENETTGSRRATFDSWKPLKLYACCELSGLPPSSQLLMLIFCWPRLEQLT